MRSGKLDLDDVAVRFEAWRANKHGRLIPAELWRAALGLLDRFSQSAICRRLRVSPARFKQVRERAKAGAAGASRRPRKDDEPGGLRPQSSPASVAMVPAEGAFVELPAVGVAVSEVGRGYRLVLESGRGTLTLLTGAPDDELVESVCRFVLGAMGSGARP